MTLVIVSVCTNVEFMARSLTKTPKILPRQRAHFVLLCIRSLFTEEGRWQLK